VAGSTSANATEMFHEGVLVPPIKIWEAGRALPDIERLILANSRQPELVRGDMQAQIAVTRMGATRVKELAGRFGAGTLTQAFAAILAGAADALEGAIAKLPDGSASTEGFLDSDGVVVERPVKLAVTITIAGGRAAFDFSASDPQAKGRSTCAPRWWRLRVLLPARQPRPEPAFQRRHARCGEPDLRAAHRHQCGAASPGFQLSDGQPDAGRRDPGSARQAQSGPRHRAFGRLERARHRLEPRPRRPIRHAIRDRRLRLWGRRRPRRRDGDRDAFEQPAHHPDRDPGIEFPCRIARFGLVPDSGGAGQWRGGLAMLREYELLEDAVVVRRSTRPASHRLASPAASPAAAPASWCGSAPGRSSRPRLRPASR